MSAPIPVLLIENNEADARVVKVGLHSVNSHATFQLAWVDRLEKGLEHLAANHVGAVLVDLSLPDSKGMRTLQRIFASAPQIPVIVFTGQTDEELGMKAVQAGAQDYLIKGQVDGRLLTRMIQYAIQRKQTETQLADALAFNEQILTASPIGILTYRFTGECVSANTCVAQMVGATIEQLKSQHFHELESWKRSGLYEMAKQAIASKKLTTGDVHIITTFGKDVWLRAQFVTFKSGREELLLLTLGDITKYKHTEAELEASEKRLRAWIENSSDLITIVDLDGIIQYQSPSAQRLLGYAQEELLGKSAFHFVHPDDLESMTAYLTEIMQTPGSAASVQCRIHHKDGSWRVLEVVGRVYSDEHGEVVALINSRDITERRQAEEALREKERLLSESQRLGHIGSWSYNIAADIMIFSDETYRLLDILPEEFRHNSQDFLALIYPADRPGASKWLKDMKDGTQAKELNFRIFRKNRELRYLYCTGAVDFDDLGKAKNFIGTIQDITDRRVAELQVDRQIKHLIALSEIDRAIMSSFDLHYTLGVILSQVISQLLVDAADVLLLDSDGQTLDYAAGKGFRTDLIEATKVRMGEGYAGRAAHERHMIRIPDFNETINDAPFDKFLTAEGFVGYIAMPLIAKGKVNGVLEVFQRTLLQPYQEWLDFFETLAGQTAIAIENAGLFGNLQATNRELMQAYEATIEGWSRAMDLRDRETEGHTQRVTKLTLKMARAFGIDESQLVHIRRGALLHDIGKLGIPDHILLKPDRLTSEEFEIMKKHAGLAYDMLSPIDYLKPALGIPYSHHEKWDGSGYPRGLQGEQIPMEARIFAIVDVWDALTSDRTYRKAWSEEETLNYILDQSGKHFDPQIVDLFFKVIKSAVK
jgi:PAS domain S-box-containing protein